MSILVGYDDSASEEEVVRKLPQDSDESDEEEVEKSKNGTAGDRKKNAEGDDSDESEDESETDSDPEVARKNVFLKGAEAAFAAMSEKDLVFKKAEQDRINMYRKQESDVPAARPGGVKQAAAASEVKSNSMATNQALVKIKQRDGMEEYLKGLHDATILKRAAPTDAKARAKEKRLKGQSGEDHNGRAWKSEAQMQMRNEYD